MVQEITQIALEVGGGYWDHSYYTVRLFHDGSATFDGINLSSGLSGSYQGEIFLDEFERLTEMIYKFNFLDMKVRYDHQIDEDGTKVFKTDQATKSLDVLYNNGKVKMVESYGDEGPIELWAIIRVVEGMCAEVDWQQIT